MKENKQMTEQELDQVAGGGDLTRTACFQIQEVVLG